MKNIIIAILISIAILIGGELWLHHNLFRYASYSNSESIDHQIEARDASDKWNVLFVGDSETHWGVDPREIDAAFARHGMNVTSFNHAFDGFGASWWARLLPKIFEAPSLKNVKVVVIGIQMVDGYRVVNATGEDCGALQKPVLTSPFAIDIGADALCRKPAWDAQLGKMLFGNLWFVRYSSTIHSLLMPKFMSNTGMLRFNSSKDGPPYRGFEPHRSIAEYRDAYDQEFTRWKAQYDPAKHFVPLPPQVWTDLTGDSGFFDKLLSIVHESGRELVLFALPTNPVVIDTFHRREDYQRNSTLLSEWASRRGVIFLDFGIQDREDGDIFFSDMRHLSGYGADIFSQQLGQALASHQALRDYLNNEKL
ncbi:MAG TPA: hypothetical protein VFM32_00640 [Spongiibacteraceae bacterium]|nr:hypothetical protein [Spongiibacteraceae bacterium]